MEAFLLLASVHVLIAIAAVRRIKHLRRWSGRQRSFAIFTCCCIPFLGPIAVLAATLGNSYGDPNLPHAVEQLHNQE